MEPWSADIRMGCAAITMAGSGLDCLDGASDDAIVYQDGRGERAGGDGATGYRRLTEEQRENFVRIVACVNACAGIPTAALQEGVIAEMKEALWGIRGRLGSLGANASTDHYARSAWEIAHRMIGKLDAAIAQSEGR